MSVWGIMGLSFPFYRKLWSYVWRESNSPWVVTAGHGWLSNKLCRGQNSFFAIHPVGTEQGSVQTQYLQLRGFIKFQSCWWGNILNILVGFFIHLFVWLFLPSNQQAVLPFITVGVFFYFKFWKLRNEVDHNYLIKSLANPANNYMWCVCVCACVNALSYETYIKTS